jgi:nucleotide-binding universal stress UspA family protein
MNYPARGDKLNVTNHPNEAEWFQTVILATDFSPTDRIAAQYASLFAREFSKPVVVAHAFTLAQPAMEAEAMGHVPSIQRERLQHQLTDLVEHVQSTGIQAEGVLSLGNPLELVQTLLQKHAPALLVLATHGGGATERHIFRSVAEEILRLVHDPVLTIGPHTNPPSGKKLLFRHILFATDFSSSAAQIARFAAALARHFGSKLDVLHVAPESALRERHSIERKQKEFITALEQQDSDPSHSLLRSQIFVESGATAERVLEHARQNTVDLIVVGAHPHSHLAMHFRTGPAFQIILEATCPVLTIGVPADK